VCFGRGDLVGPIFPEDRCNSLAKFNLGLIEEKIGYLPAISRRRLPQEGQRTGPDRTLRAIAVASSFKKC
jgi:hypothetical protein